MVIWVVGLAGVGKTTLATSIANSIKNTERNTVLIDGDVVRKIFNFENKGDYSVSGRLQNAQRIQQICKLLDDQDINVVCGILSIFEEHREENRSLFSKYCEIYLKADFDDLKRRRPIYQKALDHEIENVVGVDIPFKEPTRSDLTIDTSKVNEAEALITSLELISKLKGY